VLPNVNEADVKKLPNDFSVCATPLLLHKALVESFL